MQDFLYKMYSEMILRDYFASQVLSQLSSHGDISISQATKLAYDYADAMIKEKEKRE